jgi:hypothetical protein
MFLISNALRKGLEYGKPGKKGGAPGKNWLFRMAVHVIKDIEAGQKLLEAR